MNDFKNTNEILDFAIDNEQKAVDFYNQLAANARNEHMHITFEEFAREEMAHKAKLLQIKTEGILTLAQGVIIDLKLADYMVRTEPSTNMSYEQALVLAMKREIAAFKLYLMLAEKAESAELKALFLALAQEESRHKLRFEIEYDEYVLREN